MGVRVSGSDLADAPSLRPVRQLGAHIFRGHAAANVGDVDVVIASSAVPADNPELVAARQRGIPTMKHSAALGSLMRRRRGVAIAGTHGKTTTSALASVVLDAAGLEPTFHVGSEILGYGLFGRYGRGDLLVAEADEFDRRFLDYDPEIAVVTSVEPDHLDYFGTFEAVQEAFTAFLARVRPGGLAVVCADDPVARELACGPARRVTYGFDSGADWRIMHWEPCDTRSSACEIRDPDGKTHWFRCNLLGAHNAANAAAVVVASSWLGIPVEGVVAGLSKFQGTRRRFEVVGTAHGVTVVDDYAHHPTAVRVTLAAARAHYAGRIWVVFQPHTVHRTQSLLEEFSRCFSAADHVVIAPTYRPAGREGLGVEPTDELLVNAIEHPDCRLLPAPDAATDVASRSLPGDLILVMGAGDIWTIEQDILARLAERGAAR
jgi:UDP-N-acetylmuramate--alanine ligase